MYTILGGNRMYTYQVMMHSSVRNIWWTGMGNESSSSRELPFWYLNQVSGGRCGTL